MRVTSGFEGRSAPITGVFEAAFSESEGASEGAVIADLVTRILSDTAPDDLNVFAAEDADEIIGAVAFTRLSFPEDTQRAMLLSPMAVVPDRWKMGVGQALIRQSLRALSDDGVDIAITYGDPDYYRQVGFLPISETDVRPPLPLSMPHGWLGQRLDGDGRPSVKGPSFCVEAFQMPELW